MKRTLLAALSVVVLVAVPVRADDLVTLSGATYHHVIPERVEPDGVTWRHDSGIVKVDFADSPESVRAAYHYDAARAAAYRDRQAPARREADEQAQKLVRAHEARQQERVRLTLQNTPDTAPSLDGGTFTLSRRLDLQATAATAALDEQAQAQKAAHDLLTKDNGTIWDRRLWAIPALISGGYSPGVAFEPGANLNAQEFRASEKHRPGGYPPTPMLDAFYTPNYMTRSYYEDIDRAAAFARGVPLPSR